MRWLQGGVGGNRQDSRRAGGAFAEVGRDVVMSESKSHLEQFAHDLHQDVLAKAGVGTNPQMREDAFVEMALELLNEHNAADGAEMCYHANGGRGRIPAA